MIKLDEVFKALTEKNIRFENHGTTIGINFTKHIWDWFDLTTLGDLEFNHTYNQNTGSTKKGVMHGIRKKIQFEKKCGIKL
jgi:hypothetical protein